MNNAAAQLLHDFALALPEAWLDHPWGDTCIKVRKKIFLFVSEEREGLHFTVKLPDSAALALESEHTSPTGYGLGKHGWVSFAIPAGEEPPEEMLEGYVLESYRAVAPKTLVKRLLAEHG
ncbi:MAG: MmcQ/YjbR family DNA-binding protein [Deltaproteobacteria bacterium]|nr:MAG: MmcQ/YjbR family DNA-binding protein [Deltaproteobacteria bacterium]